MVSPCKILCLKNTFKQIAMLGKLVLTVLDLHEGQTSVASREFDVVVWDSHVG